MFFTNNLMEEPIYDFKFDVQNNIDNLIDKWNEYLQKILYKNNLSLDLINKESLIDERKKLKGFYMNYLKLSENLEKEVFQIYKYSMEDFRMDRAATVALMFFVLLLIVTMLTMKISDKNVHYDS